MSVRGLTFVFDLDDTLYPERDYVGSALRFVGAEIHKRFALEAATCQLLEYFAGGSAAPIDQLWTEANLPIDCKQSLIRQMYAHVPTISLYPDAEELLSCLRKAQLSFAIVTDGRSITQRAKIAALNCEDAVFISISEEVGIPKADPLRFKAIEEAIGGNAFVYVGDNPAKDFVAPNSLGWKTAMLLDRGGNIHPQSLEIPADHAPSCSIALLTELKPWIDMKSL